MRFLYLPWFCIIFFCFLFIFIPTFLILFLSRVYSFILSSLSPSPPLSLSLSLFLRSASLDLLTYLLISVHFPQLETGEDIHKHERQQQLHAEWVSCKNDAMQEPQNEILVIILELTWSSSLDTIQGRNTEESHLYFVTLLLLDERI